MASDLI